MSEHESLVRRFLAALESFAPRDVLAGFMHDDFAQSEHPNAMSPKGASRNRAAALEASERGRALLARQTFDVRNLVASGHHVAVEAAWTGTLAQAAGPHSAGTVLRAHIAMFIEIDGGLIRRIRNYDCYEPLALPV